MSFNPLQLNQQSDKLLNGIGRSLQNVSVKRLKTSHDDPLHMSIDAVTTTIPVSIDSITIEDINVNVQSASNVLSPVAISKTNAANNSGNPISVTMDSTVSHTIVNSGLLAATQSGSWNVGITGTPAVTVTSGTVAATQSGTWNVGTVGTLTAITDPVDSAQSGTWNVGITGTPAVTVTSGTVAATQSGTWDVGTVGTLTAITDPVDSAQSGTWNVGITGTPAVTVTSGTIAATQSGTWDVGTVGTLTAITDPVDSAQSGTWNVGITGTPAVTVTSGTVAATQSGTWNVGITGTPSVSLTGPNSIQVTNGVIAPLTSPLYTLEVPLISGTIPMIYTGGSTQPANCSGLVQPLSALGVWISTLSLKTTYVLPAGEIFLFRFWHTLGVTDQTTFDITDTDNTLCLGQITATPSGIPLTYTANLVTPLVPYDITAPASYVQYQADIGTSPIMYQANFTSTNSLSVTVHHISDSADLLIARTNYLTMTDVGVAALTISGQYPLTFTLPS